MSEKLVSYSVQDQIACIGLNDEKRLNVLSKALVTDLSENFDVAENDPSVFAIIIYGHGRAFCVGGDLKEFVGVSADPAEDFIKSWERISLCKLPVIAAVHGFAVGGGCELMLMADYVIAATNTQFSQPELNLGFIPGCGATQRLALRIGAGKAFNMMASGDRILAQHAYSMGLVDELVEDDILKHAKERALTWKNQGRDELVILKNVMKADHKIEREIFYEMVSSKKAQRLIQQFINKE